MSIDSAFLALPSFSCGVYNLPTKFPTPCSFFNLLLCSSNFLITVATFVPVLNINPYFLYRLVNARHRLYIVDWY